MRFTKKDIKDQVLLEQLITQEASRIFKSDAARHDRTYDQVYAACSQGKVAELFMVESGEYEFADLKWHDLKRKDNGELYELKTYNVQDWSAPWITKDLERYKNANWCKAKWYMLFSCHEGIYELLGTRQIK